MSNVIYLENYIERACLRSLPPRLLDDYISIP